MASIDYMGISTEAIFKICDMMKVKRPLEIFFKLSRLVSISRAEEDE